MVTRIHPEVTSPPEYDPFKDIPDIGAHENMTVREAISCGSRLDISSVIVFGECSCGCGFVKSVSSKLSRAEALFLCERLIERIMGSDSDS